MLALGVASVADAVAVSSANEMTAAVASLAILPACRWRVTGAGEAQFALAGQLRGDPPNSSREPPNCADHLTQQAPTDCAERRPRRRAA